MANTLLVVNNSLDIVNVAIINVTRNITIDEFQILRGNLYQTSYGNSLDEKKDKFAIKLNNQDLFPLPAVSACIVTATIIIGPIIGSITIDCPRALPPNKIIKKCCTKISIGKIIVVDL